MQNLVSNLMKEMWSNEFKANDLKTHLKQQSAQNLDQIMKALNFKVDDKQTKNEIINRLHDSIISQLSEQLIYFNHSHFKLIVKMLNHEGVLKDKQIMFQYIILLKTIGIAFPVIKDKQRYVMMPDEIVEYFTKLDIEELMDRTGENNLIVKYAYGFMKLYGIFDVDYFTEKINEFEKKDYKTNEIYQILYYESLMNQLFHVENHHVINNKIQVPITRIDNKHQSYYPFTQDELLNGVMNDDTVDTTELYQHIKNLYSIPELDCKNLISKLVSYLKREYTIDEVIDKFQNQYKIQHTDHLHKLQKILKNIKNNVRLYSLKGYKRSELDD